MNTNTQLISLSKAMVAATILCFITGNTAIAQRSNTKIFVRLYNSNGKKIYKGNLLSGSDSTIQLSGKNTATSLPISKIFFIKTKHAAGHAILKGTAIGTGAGLLLLAASTSGDGGSYGNNSFGIAVAGLLSPIAGIAGGGIAELFRKSRTFTINGSAAEWHTAKQILFAAQ